MARATLTPQAVAASGYPTLPLTANAADIVFTAAGAGFADGHQFAHTGREIILVQNANVGAQTVTVSSVADPNMKRTGDITTYSVGASEFACFGPFPVDGWRQTDGNMYLAATATDVKFAILRLPAIA
jgi:hypothetical protein